MSVIILIRVFKDEHRPTLSNPKDVNQDCW
jgi:hypothetical protein